MYHNSQDVSCDQQGVCAHFVPGLDDGDIYCHVGKKWVNSLEHKCEGGGTFRNFVRLRDLPELLAHMGWSGDKVAKGMRTFQEEERHVAAPADDEASSSSSSSVTPPKKREWAPAAPPPTIDLVAEPKKSESDGDEVYLKRGKTARKALEKLQPPEWAKELIGVVHDAVKERAIERYMMTTAYEQACKEAVATRVAFLEPEMKKRMRPEVEKALRKELGPEVRQKLEREQKEAMMQPFKLVHTEHAQSNDALLDSVFSVSNASFASASFGQPK